MPKQIHPVSSSLDSSIVYQDCLPLSLRLAQASETLSASEQHENLELLRAFWIFHEARTDDLKEQPELQHHLERIELKLDMQNAMLATLLRQSMELPEAVHISLGSQYLSLTLNRQYPEGSLLRVELYLLVAYHKPLVFFAKLISQEPVSDQAYMSRFELSGLHGEGQELLEKILFRHHRREIAQLRQKNP